MRALAQRLAALFALVSILLQPIAAPPAWSQVVVTPQPAAESKATGLGPLIATRSILLANSNTTPATAGGWRINDSSGGVLSIDSAIRRRAGVNTTKVDATATSGAIVKSIRIQTSVLTTHNGAIGVWTYIPRFTAGGLTLTLRWSSDAPGANPPTATATNYYALDFNNEAQQRGKWSFLSISGPSGKIFGASNPSGVAVTTTGTPTAGQVRQVELVETWNTATPSAERLFWIDSVEANGKARPMVVIGFDGFGDTDPSVSNKLAKLIQWGMKCYVAGDGNSAAAGAANLQRFYDIGCDVFSQGMNHTDYGANSSTLSTDLDQANAILRGLGFTRSLDFFAYPFNNWSAASDAVLRAKGVKLARATLGNWRVASNITGSIDPLAIGAADMDNRSAAQITAMVDEAVASGSHLFLFTHTVTSSAGSATNTNLTEYNTAMDYIGGLYQAGTIDVVTPSVFYRRIFLNDQIGAALPGALPAWANDNDLRLAA